MVEPDAPVLSRGRIAAFVVLLAAVVTWDALAPHLDPVGLWWTVAIIAVGVLPATLGLIYIALPLWSNRRVLAIGLVVLVIAAVVTWRADAHLASNFAKLGAYTCAGWLFLSLFEELSWVVIIAAIIPFVDAFSVAAGPTNDIVNHHPAVYSAVAVAFLAPGGIPAGLGPPDILFFALFLAATVRWGLRPGLTWLLMIGGLGITIVLTTYWVTGGLPALPAIALGFLLANCDLLWRRFRPRRA